MDDWSDELKKKWPKKEDLPRLEDIADPVERAKHEEIRWRAEKLALLADAERVIAELRRAIEDAEYRLATGRWPEKNSRTLQ